ncbi:MAG TPA: hypothetical protein DCL66_15505 [Gammaproteobacteria bacterium]|nr:hypothetical protein [Gammaproteobacteria bacterium]
MTTLLLRKLILGAAIGLFSQFALAQTDGETKALKQIADIVAGLNHFPSDGDMTTLEEIMSGADISQTVLIMADTVANIEHAANEEGKGAMAAIQASAQASESAKVLAKVIEQLSHTASADAKNMLAQTFP